MTTAGGGRLATSIGGTLTGRGADMIIIDDPLKAEDASSKTVRDDVLHPGRESLQTLMRIKEEVGSLTFSAQYQQRPVPHEGNLIKREWLKYYDQLPERDTGWQIVQSWDVATTVNKSSDYSVCTTWAVHRQRARGYQDLVGHWSRVAQQLREELELGQWGRNQSTGATGAK